MERPTKRKKITVDLLGLRGVPIETIKKLFRRSDEEPARGSEAFGDFRTAEKSLLSDVGATVQLPTEAGEPFDWVIADPARLLKRYVQQGSSLQRALGRTDSRLGAPLHLVIYADEVTPGNIIAPDNRRKIMMFYWTIKELGVLTTSSACWFVLGGLRSEIIKRIAGKMSCVFRRVMPKLATRSGILFNDSEKRYLETVGYANSPPLSRLTEYMCAGCAHTLGVRKYV